MSKPEIRLVAEAEQELAEAVSFYGSQLPGLGVDFAESVESALLKIRANPEIRPTRKLNLRAYPLRRFPFLIYYRIESKDLIMVFAVAHTSRLPYYWKNRS